MPATTGEFNGIDFVASPSHVSPSAGEATTYVPAVTGATITKDSTLVANFALYSATATITSAPAGWVRYFDSGDVVQNMRWYTYVYPMWLAGVALPQQNFGLSASTVLNSNICVLLDGVDPDRPFLLPPSAATGGSGTTTAMTLPAMDMESDIGLGLWNWCPYRTASGSVTVPANLTGAGNSAPAQYPNPSMRGAANLDASNLGRNTPDPVGTTTGTNSVACPWRGFGMVLNPIQKPGRMYLG